MTEALFTPATATDPLEADWPEFLPDHLSPSQMGEYLMCPEKYRLARIVKLPQRSNVKLVIGTADTRANAANMQQVIDTEEMLSVSDVQDAASDAFAARVEEDGGEGEVDWEDTKPGDALDKAVLVSTVYRQTVAPQVRPVAVEQPIEFAVEGAPLVIGYADVVEAAQTIEKKTAASLTRTIQPWWMPQGIVYAAALQQPVAFHVTTKAVSPKVTTPETDEGLLQPVEAARASALVGSVADALRSLAETKGPEKPWPGHGLTHGWACQLCPFKEAGCAWWQS